MISERTPGRRWLVALLAVSSAVLGSGCAGSVDPDELPGVYRDDDTGGEVRLDADGSFSATDVETDDASGPADFHGSWEFHDSGTTTDFVYLSVEDGGLGRTGGVQLYTTGEDTVAFHGDPDGPPAMVLRRVSGP